MKSMFINIIFLISTGSCSAQNVLFETSLKTAFEKAVLENKLVFVEYYNAECPVCKKLEPVFSDTELSKFYNENFINYKLNTENIKREDSLLIQKEGLRLESVPYFLFFDTSQALVHYSGTKQDIAYLVAIGKTALDLNERSAALVNKYNSGDRSIKTVYAYSNLLQLYKNDSLRTILSDELFKVFPKEDLGLEKSYIITKNCVNNIDNGFFKYWINHIDEFKGFEKNKKTGHESNILGDIILQSINSKERKSWDLLKIKAVKEIILKTGLSKDPGAFFWEQESSLLAKEDLREQAMELFRQRIVKDSDNINAAAYILDHYLTILVDHPDLKIIKTWIDHLSQKTVTGAEKGILMYSNIHYYKKLRDIKMAKKLGMQAINFYKDNHIDPTKLKQLLNDL